MRTRAESPSIPTDRKQTSWLYTSAPEELNQNLEQIQIVGRAGRELVVTRFQVRRLNHSATLPPSHHALIQDHLTPWEFVNSSVFMYSLGTLWSCWRKYELHNRSDITRTVVWVIYCFIPTCKISSGSFFVQPNQSVEGSSVGSSSERFYFFRVFPILSGIFKTPQTELWHWLVILL